MTAYIKENGIWKKSNLSSVKVSGEWKKTKKGFVKVNGVWKRFFSAGNEITSSIGEQTDYIKIISGEEQTWRLWTWDGAGADGEATASFEVGTSIADFEVLLLGMGGCAPGDTGMGGGGGGWVKATVSKDEMPEGTYNFTLGQYYRDAQGSAVSLTVTSQLDILDTTLTATQGGNGGTINAAVQGKGGGGGTGALSGELINFSTGTGGNGGNNYSSGGAAGTYSSISGEELDYCGGGGSGGFPTTVTTYGGPGWNSSLNGKVNASGGYGANKGGTATVGEIGGGGKRGGGAGGSSFNQYKIQPGSNGVLMISYRID